MASTSFDGLAGLDGLASFDDLTSFDEWTLRRFDGLTASFDEPMSAGELTTSLEAATCSLLLESPTSGFGAEVSVSSPAAAGGCDVIGFFVGGTRRLSGLRSKILKLIGIAGAARKETRAFDQPRMMPGTQEDNRCL